MPTDKPARMVALIYAHGGGFMARIFPAGIVCFSESIAGLKEEIEAALEDYRADAAEFSDAMDDFAQSLSQAEWDWAEGSSTLIFVEFDEDYIH